jgi:hypothetical protein
MSEPRIKIIHFPKRENARPWYIGKNTWRRLGKEQREAFQRIRDAGGSCDIVMEGKRASLKEL